MRRGRAKWTVWLSGSLVLITVPVILTLLQSELAPADPEATAQGAVAVSHFSDAVLGGEREATSPVRPDPDPLQLEQPSLALEPSETARPLTRSAEEHEERVERLLQRGREALARAAFQDAVNVLNSALKLDAGNEVVQRALSDALVDWGWDDLATRRYDQAVQRFQRGLRLEPHQPSALEGLGFAYAHLHQDREAIAVLLTAAETDPSNGRVHELLGELYDRRNDLHRAAESYRQALALSPDNSRVAARVGRLERERERQDPFVQAVTRHFTIQFDGRENRELYRTALSILEDAYGEVGRAIGFFPAEPTTVILYSQQQFEDITRSPHWTGAIFDGKIRVSTEGYEERPEVLRRILYHEYVHAAIQAKAGGPIGRAIDAIPTPRIPVWLHEGLAQYFEAPHDGAEVSALTQQLLEVSRGPQLLPLASLEGSFMSLTADQALLAYAQSRSIVAYLIDRYGMHRVMRFVDHLAANQSVDASSRSAFSASYSDIQRAWQHDWLNRSATTVADRR